MQAWLGRGGGREDDDDDDTGLGKGPRPVSEVGWGSGAEKVLNEAKVVASYAGELASFSFSNPSSKPWRHMMEGNELEVSRPSFTAMSHPVGPGGPCD